MKKLILIAALLAPAGAFADVGKDGAEGEKEAQLVCRALGETGSRLAKRRVCLTRAQWAEQKRVQRDELERAQNLRVPPGAQ